MGETARLGCVKIGKYGNLYAAQKVTLGEIWGFLGVVFAESWRVLREILSFSSVLNGFFQF